MSTLPFILDKGSQHDAWRCPECGSGAIVGWPIPHASQCSLRRVQPPNARSPEEARLVKERRQSMFDAMGWTTLTLDDLDAMDRMNRRLNGRKATAQQVLDTFPPALEEEVHEQQRQEPEDK